MCNTKPTPPRHTQCDQLAAIRAFINQLSLVQGEQDQRYMIIGPGCSVGAFTTAEVAPFYSLTQVLKMYGLAVTANKGVSHSS